MTVYHTWRRTQWTRLEAGTATNRYAPQAVTPLTDCSGKDRHSQEKSLATKRYAPQRTKWPPNRWEWPIQRSELTHRAENRRCEEPMWTEEPEKSFHASFQLHPFCPLQGKHATIDRARSLSLTIWTVYHSSQLIVYWFNPNSNLITGCLAFMSSHFEFRQWLKCWTMP
jgi:hypothetical protein